MDMLKVEQNRAVVERFFDAVKQGDMAAVAALTHADMKVDIPGRAWYSGQGASLARMLDNSVRMYAISGGTMAVETTDICASEDHVVVLGVHRAQRDGKSLTMRNASVFTIRDGKIAGLRNHVHELYETDEFYTP